MVDAAALPTARGERILSSHRLEATPARYSHGARDLTNRAVVMLRCVRHIVCVEGGLEWGVGKVQFMSDEAATGSAEAFDGRGHPGGGAGEQSPLQSRAAFIKNRGWELVVGLNRGACARGGAQHGFNRETQEACRREREEKRQQVVSLGETIEFLRQRHRLPIRAESEI